MVQARRREGGPDAPNGPARVGFTVAKQVGNAVERNRVRRRLREMVRLAPAGALHAGHDYVVIGRRPALSLPFGQMRQALCAALERVHASGEARIGKDAGKSQRGGQTSDPGTGAGRSRPPHDQRSRRRRTPQPQGRS